jgi:hypothetical protein
MAFTTTVVGAQRYLDAITGRAAAAQRTMYVAALSAAPTRTTTLATMTEITTAGYSRQTYVPSAPTSADPPVTGLSTTITLGPFTADPPSIGWLALVSASSGTTGDLVGYWTVDTAKDVGVGDSITAASGTLTISATS